MVPANAEMLQRNACLQRLFLADNQSGSKGALSIANTLNKNNKNMIEVHKTHTCRKIIMFTDSIDYTNLHSLLPWLLWSPNWGCCVPSQDAWKELQVYSHSFIPGHMHYGHYIQASGYKFCKLCVADTSLHIRVNMSFSCHSCLWWTHSVALV